MGTAGTVDFGTSGGTLTTESLDASPTPVDGTGTINTSGLVSDINLIFDSTHALKRTLTFQQSGQRVTVNLDMATSPSTNGDLGCGMARQRFLDDSGWDQGPIQLRLSWLFAWLNRCGDDHGSRLDVDHQQLGLRCRLLQQWHALDRQRRQSRHQHECVRRFWPRLDGRCQC